MNHFPFRYRKLFSLLLLLLAGGALVAQNRDSINISPEKVNSEMFISNDIFLPLFQTQPENRFLFFDQKGTTNNSNYFNFTSPENYSPGRIRFSQNKTANAFSSLGNFEHYNNNIFLSPMDDIVFLLDFGFVKQNTILNAHELNYQLSFGASAEYNIAEWFSIYGYGRYVVPKANFKKVLDPLMYMNPLFLHTETGGGVRVKFGNINADIGTQRVFDNQFKKLKYINTFNTKVSLKF